MEVLEVIKTRRSVRSYRKEKVPDDLVEKILEAGRWALLLAIPNLGIS